MKTLNQSQIKIVTTEMLTHLYNHFAKTAKQDEIVDPAIAKLEKEAAALKVKILDLRKVLKKKYPKQAYAYLDIAGYNDEVVRKNRENFRSVSFQIGNDGYRSLSFADHAQAAKAEAAIKELRAYILGLQLGTQTIADMDAILAKLTK